MPVFASKRDRFASTTSSRSHRPGRLGLGVGALLVAVVLAMASMAFACTAVMGKLTLSPTSGPPSSRVKASAVGLKRYPAQYRILFASGFSDCMASTKVLGNAYTTSSGSFVKYVYIPSTAPRGPSNICGMENSPVRNQTGTTHQSFTVL